MLDCYAKSYEQKFTMLTQHKFLKSAWLHAICVRIAGGSSGVSDW